MNYSSNILPKVVETIKASSIVAAQDVNFHSSIDRHMGNRFESSAKSLLDLANNLLKQINPDYVPVAQDNNSTFVSSWKDIEETLDTSFESVEYILDNMKATKRSKSQLLNLETDDYIDFKNQNIEKPQIHFEDALDNHDSQPFQPKLKAKPNAKTSLQEVLESMKLSDNRCPHPYEREIKEFEYPKWLFEGSKPQPSNDWESTLATWVDNVNSLKEMLDELRTLNEIAVDLEHHDYRSYYGITCLMQLSNRQFDWVVDTIALRNELHALNEIFTDPKIVKVFHGANMDIIWLQRDLGLYVVSLFDTYHASKALGFPKFSLAYLLEEFAHFRTSKKYQLADWRVRPLPRALFEYARADTHFLLNIFDQLRNKLIAGNGEKLKFVLDQSRSVACRKFEYKKFRVRAEEWSSFDDRDAESRFISQNNIPSSQKLLVKYLMDLRDDRARTLDESVRFIMPNQVLINLCTLPNPVTHETLKRALGHCGPHFEQNFDDMISALNSSNSSTNSLDNVSAHSEESRARHYAELYLRMQKVEKKFCVSNQSLIQQSTLVPQFLRISNPNRNFVTRSNEAFKSIYETFFSEQKSLDHSSGMNLDELQINKATSHENEAINSENSKRDEIEVLKPLRRRDVSASKNKVTALGDLSKFDYNKVENTVLNAQSKKAMKRKSYDPNMNSMPSNIKKPKTRKGFQDGKSTSFSTHGKYS